MSRPGTGRTIAIALAMTAWLAGLAAGGCAGSSSPPAKRTAAGPVLNAETRPPADATGEDDYTDLLAQAQRAVDDAMTMQTRRAAPATPPPPAKIATTPPASGAPAIRWNMPEVTPATPISPAQPSLARDTPDLDDLPPIATGVTVERGREPDSLDPLERPDDATVLDPMRMQLVQLRRELYQLSVESDQPIRELIAIAAMGIIDPEMDLPQSARSDLTTRERELLTKMHAFFVELGTQLGGDVQADEAIREAVQSLQEAVVEHPALVLPAALICWRVGGFGDYDTFSPSAFLAHAEQQVILYLEIEGFTSELNQKQRWVTELSQQLEIYSALEGVPVWSETWQKAVDVANKQRRDFFTTQLITLPKALSVGRYHLKVRVRDEKSGALVETSIPLEMVADPKRAARAG